MTLSMRGEMTSGYYIDEDSADDGRIMETRTVILSVVLNDRISSLDFFAMSCRNDVTYVCCQDK